MTGAGAAQSVYRLCYGVDGPEFEFRWGQEIFSACSGTYPASFSEGTGGFSLGLKQPGRDVNQQPPSSAADKNEWGPYFSSNIYLHVVDMDSILGK